MIRCEQLTGLATDYMEGLLPVRLRFEVLVHTVMCSSCRAYLRQMRLTVQLAAALPAEEPPTHVRQAVLERVAALDD